MGQSRMEAVDRSRYHSGGTTPRCGLPPAASASGRPPVEPLCQVLAAGLILRAQLGLMRRLPATEPLGEELLSLLGALAILLADLLEELN